MVSSFIHPRSIRQDAFSIEREIALLARAIDWSKTELGLPDSWPSGLRTALAISLAAPDPTLVLWGRSHLVFPNPAFRPFFGPGLREPPVGRRAEDVLRVFPILGPHVDRVLLHGTGATIRDVELTIERDGRAGEAWASFHLTPIAAPGGPPSGVMIRAEDVSGRAALERRVSTLRQLVARTDDASSNEEICQAAAVSLGSSEGGLPFVLVYLAEAMRRRPKLLGAFGLQPGTPASPRALATDDHPWPFERALRGRTTLFLDRVLGELGPLLPAGLEEPVRSVFVLPIGNLARDGPHGILVAGLHPRRARDESVQEFLEVAAHHVSLSIERTRLREMARTERLDLASHDRVKVSFFKDVSHEFRAPLTLMVGPLTDVLDDLRAPLPPEHRERLEVVRRNCMRVHRMVDTLLDLARIDAGRVAPLLEPLDLSGETGRIAELFRPQLERSGIRFELGLAPLREPIFADREMWEKIVLNLLSNAVKFTGSGSIGVAVALEATRAVLMVSDTGIGIASDDLPRVFERFHRIERNAMDEQGAGIGLALVKSLVELHGGDVKIESALGRGTRVTVSIPRGSAHVAAEHFVEPRPKMLVPVDAAPYLQGPRPLDERGELIGISETSWLRERTSSTTIPVRDSFGRSRVLVVSASSDLRAHLSRVLATHARVTAAADVASGLESARDEPPDLVVAEAATGLVSELRRDPRTSAIPCLLLSSKTFVAGAEPGFDPSTDDNLQKPFASRDLLARATALIEIARFRAELTRREEAARLEAEESRRFLATLIGNLPGMAFRGKPDRERTMGFASDGIQDLTGYPPAAFTEREVSYGRLIHRDDLQRAIAELERAVEEKRPYRLIYRLINANGEERWVREQGRPIYRPGGAFVALEGLVIDITELKWTEEQLREESRTVRTIHQVGSYLSAELSLEKVVETVTNAATELIGADVGAFFYRQGARPDAGFALLTISGPGREDLGLLWRFPATPLFRRGLEARSIVRLDDVTEDSDYPESAAALAGREGISDVRSYIFAPLVSSSGELLGALVFGHSEPRAFSEREEQIVVGLSSQAAIAVDNARLYRELELSNERFRQVADKAESANRAKDEFLATLSHEMRTPLNAMLGWTQLLNGDSLDRETFSRAARSIERNTRALAQLINDLLDVSRIVMGKLSLEMRPVSLVQVVAAAVETVRPLADAKGVHLATSLGSVKGMVSGDAARLQQVVWNLLTNGIKFTPSGGHVKIALEETTARLKVTISDTGRGITPDFLPHIFERFRQADSSSTRLHGGLGLGLAIVRHLVELHGGSIHAWSEGEGRGAMFTVELPPLPQQVAQRPERRGTSRIEWHAELPGLDGVRVLIVDDELDARECLGTLLEQAGAVVTLVGSADEALQALDAEVPDVIVSDIGMPKEDGYALIRKIRARPPERGGTVPAIAVTAYAAGQDRERALAEGFTRHLPKPIEARDLIILVARVVARGRQPTPPEPPSSM
jgi:PAS domain S-box-containing protein